MNAPSRAAVSTLFFINGLTFGTWVAHLPLLKARLHLSDGALGIALLGAAIASIVTLPLAGTWIARRGSRSIAIAASLAAVATLVLPYVAPSYGLLLVSTFVLGTAYSAMDVAMNAQAVLVERTARRPIMSSFHGIFSAGGLVGAIASALALATGGSAITDTVAISIGAEFALVIAVRGLVDAPREPHDAAPGEGARPRKRTLAAGVAVLGAIAFFGLVGEGAIADWSAIYLRTSLGAGVAAAAAAFAAFSFAMAVGRFAGDAVVARFGRTRTLVVGALVAASALAAALGLHRTWFTYVGFACAGLGLANVIPVAFGLAGRIRGLGDGIGIAGVSTLGYAGFLVGPPVIGFVSDACGLRIALGLVACGIVAIVPLASRIDDRPIVRAA